MNRTLIWQKLHEYSPVDQHEEQMRHRMAEFVANYEECHSRALAVGHLTGSAWILDQERTHALLTHHGKLNLWVQLGGHVEDDGDMLAAAWREAREESGLADVHPIRETIFDLDIHEIPANPKEAAHLHYDIRYLFTADRRAPLVVSSESRQLAWVPLEHIHKLTSEESIHRMLRKTRQLFS